MTNYKIYVDISPGSLFCTMPLPFFQTGAELFNWTRSRAERNKRLKVLPGDSQAPFLSLWIKNTSMTIITREDQSGQGHHTLALHMGLMVDDVEKNLVALHRALDALLGDDLGSTCASAIVEEPAMIAFIVGLDLNDVAVRYSDSRVNGRMRTAFNRTGLARRFEFGSPPVLAERSANRESSSVNEAQTLNGRVVLGSIAQLGSRRSKKFRSVGIRQVREDGMPLINLAELKPELHRFSLADAAAWRACNPLAKNQAFMALCDEVGIDRTIVNVHNEDLVSELNSCWKSCQVDWWSPQEKEIESLRMLNRVARAISSGFVNL